MRARRCLEGLKEFGVLRLRPGFCAGAWSETGLIVDQNWQTMMVHVARTVDVWKAAGVNEITQ